MAESMLITRPWAIAAGVLGFVMTAIYLTVVLSEETNSVLWIAPWAVLMAAAGVICIAAALVHQQRTARALLIGAVVLYAVLGLLAIFTIGLGFFVSAAAALFAITRLPAETQ